MESHEVASLSDLVGKCIEWTNGDDSHEWWFRGHGRSSFRLVPSLFREIPGDVTKALATEGQLLREFDNRSRTLKEAASARSPWEILFLMQHHGVPTRLLDWSRSLMIASFFAAFDEHAWADDADPPAVIMFDPHQWNSSVVGTAGVAESLGPVTDLLSGTMGGYQPRYSGAPIGALQEHAVAISGPEFAGRIVAQRGAFTIFGTKTPEAEHDMATQMTRLTGQERSLVQFRLTGDRDEWRRSIRLLGIGAFTAFPDLSGLASELKSTHIR